MEQFVYTFTKFIECGHGDKFRFSIDENRSGAKNIELLKTFKMINDMYFLDFDLRNFLCDLLDELNRSLTYGTTRSSGYHFN
jgi:hypothetical protein